MKTVHVEDSIGMVLCHDLTQIVPGEKKGPAFRKGHIIKEQDIALMLEIGKEHIYVLNLKPGQLHENDAARRICRAVAGPGLALSEVCEGRINLVASPGLLRIDVDGLNAINSIEQVVVSTMHDGMTITRERPVAGARVIPLVVDEERVAAVEAICAKRGPILQVKPFKPFNIGVVTTGSEIYHGRIKDKFGPVIRKKFGMFGSNIMNQTFVSDERDMARDAIMQFVDDGADMVVLTGGMSVDPDDQTPAAIRATGAEVVTYGSPTFPGAMFMLAYLGDTPIVGLPGCVMYYRASIFDLVIPRILAGERVTREDIVALGHGGFCAACEECRFPICPFGKHG